MTNNKKPEIIVEQETCTGCYRCIEVCPKGVFKFEDGKSHVVHLNECIICTACFRQCPAGAIKHSNDTYRLASGGATTWPGD